MVDTQAVPGVLFGGPFGESRRVLAKNRRLTVAPGRNHTPRSPLDLPSMIGAIYKRCCQMTPHFLAEVMIMKYSVCLGLLIGLSVAYGAEVPPGTKLAAKQEIVIGNGAEPASLDPARSEGNVEFTLGQALFEGLVVHDANGKILPGVAEKWESRDGGKTWFFSLRKNALWSDGTRVTAMDFEYAWKRLADPKTASPVASSLSHIANIQHASEVISGRLPTSELGVKAMSDTSLKVTLEQPISHFIDAMTYNGFLPVPRAVLERYGEKWTEVDKLVGNGPYRIGDRVVNERIDLVKNANYWNREKVVINKVSFRPVVNASAVYQRYRANDIDMSDDGGVPTEQFEQIRRDSPQELVIWPKLGVYFYVFNTRKPPFDDARVRRALSLAINRELITDQILRGGQRPAYSMTPLVTQGYVHVADKWEGATQSGRDSEARRLLQDAGFSPAKPLKFPLLYNTSEQHKKLALSVAAMWRRIGSVEVELVNQEWKTYLDSINRGDFVVARRGWVLTINTPVMMLGSLHSTHWANDGKYSNAKFDEFIDRAMVSPDATERSKLFSQAESILAEDAPAAFVYHYTNQRLVKPWVKGIGNDPSGFVKISDLYIAEH